MSRTVRRLGPLVALAALIGCDDGFFVRAEGPASMAVVASFSQAAGGAAAAYDRADAVRVRAVPVDGQGDGMDRVFPFTADGSAVSVTLDLAGPTQDFDVTTELTAGGEVLFTGQARVTLSTGEVSRAVVTLDPVPSEVKGPGSVFLDALGATLQLEAAALFATGDTVPSADLSWRVVPGGESVVSVTSGGLLTALTDGDAEVEVASGTLTDRASATVRAAVASVLVSPDEVTLDVGGRAQLSVTVLDPGGTAIDRPVSWTSDRLDVASVDPSGLVTAIGEGTAFVTASAEGVPGTARVDVYLPRPVVGTGQAQGVTTGASLTGTVDPVGYETRAWFRWGTDPELSDYQETLPEIVSPDNGPVVLSHTLGDGTLGPGTRYYFRVVAQNEASLTEGEIATFVTPPMPTSTASTPYEAQGYLYFEGTANTFGLGGTAWFEFSYYPSFSQVLAASEPQTLPVSGNPVVFTYVAYSGDFPCCTTLYVRAVVSSPMGTTASQPTLIVVPG